MTAASRAPGDRRDNSGTLWLDYPSVGGDSPDIPVVLEGNSAAYFCTHSSLLPADIDTPCPRWVAASGVKDVTKISLTLASAATASRKYTVKLHLVERETVKPGDRIFDIKLPGAEARKAVDIIKTTGAKSRPLTCQFDGVEVTDTLEITFHPRQGKPPVVCGIEVIAEP